MKKMPILFKNPKKGDYAWSCQLGDGEVVKVETTHMFCKDTDWLHVRFAGGETEKYFVTGQSTRSNPRPILFPSKMRFNNEALTEKELSSLEVGDEVWAYTHGPCTFVRHSSTSSYPLKFTVKDTMHPVSFTKEGKHRKEHDLPVLFKGPTKLIPDLPSVFEKTMLEII
jgi:hypothetical protein